MPKVVAKNFNLSDHFFSKIYSSDSGKKGIDIRFSTSIYND
jgi:hypothetical protein